MRILAGLATLLLAACSIHEVRTVTVTVSPDRVTVDRPPYMAVGDSLAVHVRDERYANRYVATTSESTLAALDRAPLFGATDLKPIQLSFGANRTATEDDGAPFRQSDAEEDGAEDDGSEGARTAFDEAREAEFNLEAVALLVRARLDSLRTAVINDPDELARLRLLVDDEWAEVADSVTADPAPIHTAQLLKDLAAGQIASIAPPDLEATRRQAERYARRLNALRALLPADPPAGGESESVVRVLMERLANDLADYEEREREADARWRDVHRAGQTVPPRERLAQLPTSMRVSGIDIRPWLEDPDQLQADVEDVQARIAGVNQRTELLARALNQLPAWTFTSGTDTIFTQLFATQTQVKVVVMRKDRYAPFTTAAPGGGGAAAVVKGESDEADDDGSVTVTTTTTIRSPRGEGDGEEEDEEDAGDDDAATKVTVTGLVPPAAETVAVVDIPVLQRYRFHLGVGMVYSTLASGVFQTTADTVDGMPGVNVVRTATDEGRLLPMAMLSYTLYPFGGRYVDGRAYRAIPIVPPNLSVQAGISLSDPSKHLYAGVSAELFPGLDLGVGHHFGYVQTTRREGEFVPVPRTAVTERWLNGWAYSLTLDTTTFLAAFGKIFGLK